MAKEEEREEEEAVVEERAEAVAHLHSPDGAVKPRERNLAEGAAGRRFIRLTPPQTPHLTKEAGREKYRAAALAAETTTTSATATAAAAAGAEVASSSFA